MTELREAASAALFRGSDVLIIRRAFAPLEGHWSLPGGRLEPGETPETCMRRELMEELGLAIGDARAVTRLETPGFRLTVFAANLPAETALTPNGEIAGWRWLSPDEALPEPHTNGLGEVLAKARAVLRT